MATQKDTTTLVQAPLAHLRDTRPTRSFVRNLLCGAAPAILGTLAATVTTVDVAHAQQVGAIWSSGSATTSGASAAGANGYAAGSSANAFSTNSTAVGYSAVANATNNSAFGQNAVASGATATALGQNTIANAAQTTAVG